MKTHLAEVPPGTLVEVSPHGEEHPHPPAPIGPGRWLEHYPLFPGAVFTHLWVLGSLPTATPPWAPALGSPTAAWAGWGGRWGGLTLTWGLGTWPLHPMACCPIPCCGSPWKPEGFSLSPGRGDLKGPPAPALALGRVDPGSCWRILPCEACRPPTRADLDHIFRPLYDLWQTSAPLTTP